jgi:hypothetical protein
MSGVTPIAATADLSAATIIEGLAEGSYPAEVVATMAAGFLPLPQDELIAVLAYLTVNGSETVCLTARASLGEVPARSLAAFASNESAPPEHLELLLRATDDPPVLESLIRNRSVSDLAVEVLARRADPEIQEIIAINQSRLLRSPQILDALEANPGLTQDVRRRVLETREEFFSKKARQQPAEPAVVDEDEVLTDLPVTPILDLLEKAAAEEAQGSTAPPPPELLEPEKQDAVKMSVFSKILTMSVSEKVQLAFKGGKTERMILVRDRNRLVCSAVIRNPRMNEQEVEAIAGMRNLDDEVLRLISMKREWMAKYNLLLTLARNPKCPIAIVLPLINRLTLRDLKALKDDKGVSEAVRTVARKAFVQRSQKQ